MKRGSYSTLNRIPRARDKFDYKLGFTFIIITNCGLMILNLTSLYLYLFLCLAHRHIHYTNLKTSDSCYAYITTSYNGLHHLTISEETSQYNEITKMVYDLKNGENLGIQFIKNVKGRLDILADRNAPAIIMKSNTYKNNYMNLRNRGATIRFLTEITKDNIQYCKELTEIVDEFRHLDRLKGSLCISESEFISTTTTWKQRQSRYPIIYSKEKQFIEQQQFIFDTIWKKATSVTQRVLEIEKGVAPVFIESSLFTRDSRDKAYGIMSSANKEILQIYSTSKAFHRQLDTGGINKLKEMGRNKLGLIIKILTPKDDEIEKIVTKLNDSNFMVKFIEPLSRISIVVVDRKYSLIIETKDDSKQILTDAIGFMTYSNSVPTVLTYAAIFDNFWKQAELYEETSNELYKAKDEIEEMKEYLNYALKERSKMENKVKEGL